jgi:hypothetical protein
MALITQKTNLKSLRYGKDRPGGGSSNQPYIISSLPGDPSSFNTLSKELKFLDKVVGAGKNIIDFAGTDFFLRGGSAAVSRAAKDVSRLTQMFADFKSPNGVLFAAKQNVLSLTGVKTQASGIMNEGIYLPTSTILQAGGNAFGVHLNKQGLNPFRKTAPSEGFIGGLFEFTGPLGLPTYAQTVKPEQKTVDNRLVQLKNAKLNSPYVNSIIAMFQAENAIGEARARTQRARAAARANDTMGQFRKDKRKSRQSAREDEKSQNKNNIPQNNSDVLLRYGGGPNSLLGIGQTTIRRYSNTGDGLDFRKNPDFKGKYFVLSSSQIEEKDVSKEVINIIDFRTDLIDQQTNSKGKKNILSISPNYATPENRIENRFNLGDPGRRDKNVTNYTAGLLRPEGDQFGALDRITYFPLYSSTAIQEIPNLNDFVTFSIGIYDNTSPSKKVYIHFRALLDSMDDNYAAEWNSFKYVGRGENFYRYGGFTRTINLGWTVAAQSKQELIPMYQKLNFLASSLAPDYSKNGYMRGNLATLTVGGYLYEQPGIITSINYSVPQESPWEIGISNQTFNPDDTSPIPADQDPTVKQLPHIIKVTGFQFIPIHNFVPRKQQNDFGTKEGQSDVEKFGKERYIALKKGSRDNYIVGEPLRDGAVILDPTTNVGMGTYEDINKIIPR